MPSKENLADFFTKALPKNEFFYLRDRLMNVPLSERVSVKVPSSSPVSREPVAGHGGVLKDESGVTE